ncbi:MAG: MarR family winged helix-turn-helix transcriptional regulator [Porticoccaceae bacterium]
MTIRLMEQTLPAHSGGIKSDFHVIVHNIARLQRTLFDRSFKPLQITRSQWWALKTLAVTGGEKSNQTDLAAQLSIGKASLGKLLAPMEARGLLVRNVDPADQRAHNIAILDGGVALLDQAAAIERELSLGISSGISAANLAVARQVLLDAKANINRKNIGSYPKKFLTSHTVAKIESITGQSDPNWIGYLVHDVSRMRRSVVDRLLQPLGITRSQWWILSFLEKRDGMTKGALAKELELTRSSLSAHIVRLEENELLRVRQDPEDLRRSRVMLTKAGLNLIRSIRDATSQAEDFVLSNIPEDNLKTAVQALAVMKSNISQLLDSATT